MLAQAAEKIKALNSVLARPFVVSAEKLQIQGKDPAVSESGSRFVAEFSRSRRDIIRAQRLRYRIFSEEYGASIKAPFGLDRDRFDKHCLHLLVWDTRTGELVGYTRVLTLQASRRAGGFYSASEFDLAMLARLPGQVAEIGRTCIHPAYRGGAVIAVLWSRLAQFMIEEQIDHLIGCASVALNEGYDVGAMVARIGQRYLSAPGLRVTPRLPLRQLSASDDSSERMPALLKAYLRMGAQVCGEPCWDPDFNCIDFFILLSVTDLPARYVQHFLQPAPASKMAL
ncbi:GNAT family N-acetyltransferase [Alcanivorax sp. 1008]|uniref:GNAT family N-acetyltransferase n=1 Tax=Alcanivorax sp. 1008 TaxID=2816853 RepID=UPI001E178A18|nr:GNAT family N-acetyltransferase [Alcanivorax sp. 1008]MCC1495418.1 GNAT family N-acetyltransferase [Alcanivorax sp. 1008]